MSKLDLTGLNNFIDKVNTFSGISKLKEKIKEIGLEEFESAYASDPDFTNLQIEADTSSKKGITFYIKDMNERPTIAFFEFGTGFYSLDYEGKKPTQTIIFHSNHAMRSTAGWQYYYENPKSKRTVAGLKGWFLPRNANEKFTGFDIGEGAHNTFYRACQKIKQRLKEELGIDVL